MIYPWALLVVVEGQRPRVHIVGGLYEAMLTNYSWVPLLIGGRGYSVLSVDGCVHALTVAVDLSFASFQPQLHLSGGGVAVSGKTEFTCCWY